MTTPPTHSYFPPPPPPSHDPNGRPWEPPPLDAARLDPARLDSARLNPDRPPANTPDGGLAVRVLCWTVIIVLVAVEILGNVARDEGRLATPATQPTTRATALATTQPTAMATTQSTPQAVEPATAKESSEATMGVAIGGRYAVAVHSWEQDKSKDSVPQLLDQIRTQAKTTTDRFDLEIVTREIDSAEKADKQLAELKRSNDLTESDRQTLRTLQKIDQDGPHSISEADRKALLDRLDWYGKLALIEHLPANDPQRTAVINDTHRLLVTTLVATVLFVCVLVAGVGLLITAIVLGASGRLHMRYARPMPGTVYLEVFALYMLIFFAMQLVLPLFVKGAILQVEVAVLFALVPVALIWPVIRGATWQESRLNLGWHTGQGVLTEMAAGVGTYVASLPLLALAFGLTQLLIKIAEAMHWVGSSPTHPIVHYLTGSPGTVVCIYLLASVCAPILEETMFRGALFNHLRGRHGWWISAFVVSFIFAAIHPQGWTLIPTLGALAMSFAAMRQWRSSLIPSMTAHAINNTVVLTIAILMLR